MSDLQTIDSGKSIPPAAELSFEDLLSAVGRRRDRAAFIHLFEYFAPRIKSFLMRGGFRADLADELAQETMLTVWTRAESFDPARASAATWIFTIARNKRIDALRRVRPEPDPADPALTGESPDLPDARLNHTEQAETLARAISHLPSEQGELIRKAYFEDKTHNDIAAETKLPLGTVKSRIRLGLERMRQDLRGIAV